MEQFDLLHMHVWYIDSVTSRVNETHSKPVSIMFCYSPFLGHFHKSGNYQSKRCKWVDCAIHLLYLYIEINLLDSSGAYSWPRAQGLFSYLPGKLLFCAAVGPLAPADSTACSTTTWSVNTAAYLSFNFTSFTCHDNRRGPLMSCSVISSFLQ